MTGVGKARWPLRGLSPAVATLDLAMGGAIRRGIATQSDTESWEIQLRAVARPERFDVLKVEAVRRAELIEKWWTAQPDEPPLDALGWPMTPLAMAYRSVVYDVISGWLG